MDFQGLEPWSLPYGSTQPCPLLRSTRELQRPYHGQMVVSFLAQTALRAFTTCPPSLPIPLGPSPHSLLPP